MTLIYIYIKYFIAEIILIIKQNQIDGENESPPKLKFTPKNNGKFFITH